MSVMHLSEHDFNVLIKSAIQALWCGTHIEEAKQIYDRDFRKLTPAEIMHHARKIASFSLKLHERINRIDAKMKGRLYDRVDDLLDSIAAVDDTVPTPMPPFAG